MIPPTVVAVKLSDTQVEISDPVPLPPRPPPGPPPTSARPTAAADAAGDEVVDLTLGDVLLELRQGRPRVAAVEPADGEHRLPLASWYPAAELAPTAAAPT